MSLEQSMGYYIAASENGPAEITIFVDRVMASASAGQSRILASVWQRLELLRTLYHEVGHHVQQLHRDPRRQKENFADKYAMQRTLRWICRPLFLWRLVLPAVIATLKIILRLQRRKPTPASDAQLRRRSGKRRR